MKICRVRICRVRICRVSIHNKTQRCKDRGTVVQELHWGIHLPYQMSNVHLQGIAGHLQ